MERHIVKRTTFMALLFCCILLCAVAVAGCTTTQSSSTSSSGSSSTQATTATTGAPETLEASDNTDLGRKVVCWGDSLTYGMGASDAHILTTLDIYDASYKSYPEVLRHFTGLPTLNFGFPGASSDEIVSMYTGLANMQSSLVIRPFNSESEPNSVAREGDVLIIEMGSNGGWEDYDELIAQYWEMIEYGGCTDYLVLGDTDDPGTSFADENQWQLPWGAGTQETLWEQALHEAFGDHFVNTRVYLVEHGLEVTGLEATWEDTENAQMGCISEQLRADHTHLNSYGYYAQACAVYEQGKLLGYWS